MSTKKKHSSRDLILMTAVDLFARKGYASAGMRELAETAQVNLAMINYHFGSKKGLLKVILDTFFQGYLDILEAELTKQGSLDQKISDFIHSALSYIADHRQYMLVTLTELPHDDPEITEHKAQWAKKAMETIQREICIPLQETRGVEISPATIGPLLIGMMSSRFLFAPIMDEIKPPGYGDAYFAKYPDIVTTIFISGIKGLDKKSEDKND